MTGADELHKRKEQAGELDLLTILEENIRLQAEVDSLRALFDRPIQTNVQISSPEKATLDRVIEYLPQLTYIATNISNVASAGQENSRQTSSVAGALMRIATALEKATGGVGGPVSPIAGANVHTTSPIATPQAASLSQEERRRIGSFRGQTCSCEGGASHPYQPGWCPPSGPRFTPS